MSLAYRIVVAAIVLATSACDAGQLADRRPRPSGSSVAGGTILRVRCVQRISGGVIREYENWKSESVRIGAVYVWPAATFADVPPSHLTPVRVTAEGPRFHPDQLKVQLIVPRGVEAVVALVDPSRSAFFFRAPWRPRGSSLSQGVSALDVSGCDDAPFTEYSSGLVVAAPGCVAVRVEAGRADPETDLIPVGVRGCP